LIELPESIAKLHDHDQSQLQLPEKLQIARIQTVILKAIEEILPLVLWFWLPVESWQQLLQVLPKEHWGHVWLEYLEEKRHQAGMLEH
jgi:hypothetical protein